ncbi:MAG: hypothetical protein P8Q19_06215 [Planktomarina sp.]|nr:hypothetical protein [Planktomarina sp.]
MIKTFKWIAFAGIAASLTACATPEVIDTKQMGDDKLSCKQLAGEIQEANEFERKAHREKGITGTNVAAAVIFWPAIIGTYSNANEAIKAAKERKEHLVASSTKKGCSLRFEFALRKHCAIYPAGWVDRFRYLPFQIGSRFSAKALAPSS